MAKTETVKKILRFNHGEEKFDTSRGELTYESLRDEIRRGQTYVVEGKDADGKKQERALTVTTQGDIVYNDTQAEIRNGMEVEVVVPKEQKK